MPAFVHERIIEFHETDAAGLVHFSNYFRFAEAAEHALFRSIGYPMMRQDNTTFFGWPRVRAKAKYSAPLYSGDAIRVELRIEEIKAQAIGFAFKIVRVADELLTAKGSFTTMHVRIDGVTRDMKSMPIPAELVQALQPFFKENAAG